MRSLAEYAGQWVALDADRDVRASGDSPEEALRRASDPRCSCALSAAWVSPHRPHIALPQWPLTPVRRLAKSTLWLAGGPVRDLLLGREPGDWDFVVARGALSLARAVANALDGDFYPLDAARGTGRAIVRRPGGGGTVSLDFAELRGPTIDEDLRLRDFTINAMALTPDGLLVDPTDGAADLQHRVIRLTHPESLRQDPVRLVRAVRLSAELDFDLSPEAVGHIRQDAHAVKTVAAERVRDELVKVFAPSHASRGFRLLSDLDLVAHVLPEATDAGVEAAPAGDGPGGGLGHAVPDRERLLAVLGALVSDLAGGASSGAGAAGRGHARAALDAAVAGFGEELAGYLRGPLGAGLTRCDLAFWSALFVRDRRRAEPGLCGAAAADRRLTALRFPVRSRDFVRATVQELWRFAALPAGTGALADDVALRRHVYRYFRAAGHAGLMAAILSLAMVLAASDPAMQPPGWDADLGRLRTILIAFFRMRSEVIDPRPLLTGRDLLQLGYAEGPDLGRALARLAEAQAAGEVRSASEAGAWLASVKPDL